MVVGIAAQLSLTGVALAQFTPQTLKVQAADPNDTARTNNGRLRKTRYEETNEQAVVQLFADGKTGLYVDMHSGSLNGVSPVHRQQVSCTPIQLTQNADGSVGAQTMGPGVFVTDNVGQDYRNGNKPQIVPINNGKNMLLMFNYRPQGTNNTNRYVKVLDASCNEIPITDANGNAKKQVLVMHKDNDDCDMHQSGEGPCDISSDAAGTTNIACWAGCNGNGQDDGWLNDVTVKCQTDATTGAATGCQILKNFDVSLCKREERSRGRCSIADADPNTAICTWTEGNDQPQTDGTWIAAVDISPTGEQGEAAQSRVLWKKMLDGEKRIEGKRTWSVRANSSRILTENPDGTLSRSTQLFVDTSDLHGNNTNNRKGGAYLQQNVGVVEATKDGLKWIINLTNVTPQMLGIDATHLTVAQALVQDDSTGKTIPALTFLQGSQNGAGAAPPDLKILAADVTAGKFVDYGTHPAGGMYDRHLYSNYLGGNPGNQGRNFAGAEFVKNPFYNQNGNTAKYLMLHALTGKDTADVDKPEIKPSDFLSIVPMENPKPAAPPPPGMPANTMGQNGSGGGQNAQPMPSTDPQPSTPPQMGSSDPAPAPAPAQDNPAPSSSDPSMGTPQAGGGFSGGCSFASGVPGARSTGGVMLMLLGLCLLGLVRRRTQA